MKKGELRVPDYLGHILQAIDRIALYTKGLSKDGFLDNPMIQDAVIRNIEVIGEAARNIEKHHPEFAGHYPDIPWEDVYLMRNRVSHGYFSVDLDIVWNALQRDLPELARQVQDLNQSL